MTTMRKLQRKTRNRRARLTAACAIAIAIVAAGALAWSGQELPAQEAAVTGSTVSLSSASASLELELADGETHSVVFEGGVVVVDGVEAGAYEPGGTLETSWRELLAEPAMYEAEGVVTRLGLWGPEASGEVESATARVLEELFDRISGAASAPREASRPDGGRLTIAPGTMSLRDLTGRIELLRRSIERLGGRAVDVGDDIALVVHEDYQIGPGETVAGNVAVLSGELTLNGVVRGDVLVLDGALELGPDGRIEGDILQLGGDPVEATGRVTGEIVSLVTGDFGEDLDISFDTDLPVEIDAPVSVHLRSPDRGLAGRVTHNVSHAVGGVMGVLAWLLALGALGLAVVYFFGRRLEVVADAVRADVVRSFGVGLAGELLVAPVLLLLIVGIVTWLLIPVYTLAVALALPAGYLAVAHAVGEAMSERKYDWMERLKLGRTSSYHHLLNGLLFMLAPFAIGSALYLFGGLMGFVRGMTFFAAGVLTWAALTTGFGAVILTRGGSRRGASREVDLEDLFAAGDSLGEEGGEASA